MATSLLSHFEKLDSELKHALSEETSPLKLSLAALEIASTQANVPRLTVEHIVACLEAAGVAVKKASITKALARAGKRVSSESAETGETSYRVMTVGKKEVESLLIKRSISVVRIDGGRPHTARQHLGELLANLTGTLRICDPYYGIRTLETLDYISPKAAIRFLTSKTQESSHKVHGACRDFAKERKNVEFRILPPPHDLHDRYVLTDQVVLLVGHGLKDIGGRESFIVCLEKKVIPDLISDISQSFDRKWTAGIPL